MHAIFFDERDAGRGCTLRVFDDSRMALQAWLFEVDPVAQGRRLCELLEIEMEYRGPAAATGEPRRQPPPPPPDTDRGGFVARASGWLF